MNWMRGLREIQELRIISRLLASIFNLSEPVSCSVKWGQLEHVPGGIAGRQSGQAAKCSQWWAHKPSVNVSSGYRPKDIWVSLLPR